jgi:predicted dehydrogenase
MATNPVGVAIIGMGGFAAVHHRALLGLEAQGAARLVATCDLDPQKFLAQRAEWQFARRQVRVFDDYRAMIAGVRGGAELLVIPTPIPLHAEMHRAGVEAGLAIYLEKPPTLDPVELEEMIATDCAARYRTLVGFNFIVEPERQALKARILGGAFGALQRADLMAHWPRPRAYYQRANWAGRLLLDGRLILDSPLGNAMAHQVHNLFYWLGTAELFHWAPVAAVRAELYRAHAIQGADTFFLEGATAEGLPFRISMSHACDGAPRQWERIVCERATITWTLGRSYRIVWADGRVEEHAVAPMDYVAVNHQHFYDYLAGKQARPLTLLEDARPFVALNNLVYLSADGITPIPAASLAVQTQEQDGQHVETVAWIGLEEAAQQFFRTGAFPSAHQEWGRPGRVVTTVDPVALAAAVRRMAEG